MKTHIKELDGLRGIAILLVIALHVFKRAAYFTQSPILLFVANLTAVGWVGVDIFFTLSGFLITSILLRALDSEHYFRDFYVRRALRIFPLYYAGIAVVILFAPDLEREFTSNIYRILPVMLLYQQNWLAIFGDEHLQVTKYLWLTWSLAIEEQFYICWPLVVYFVKKEALIKLCAWSIILSVIARVLGAFVWDDVFKYSAFFYHNSFTRFEEIIIGGLLATLLSYEHLREKIKNIALPVFLVFLFLFVTLCFLALPGIPSPTNNVPITVGGYTSAGLFSAALIAMFVTYPQDSLVRQIFRNKTLMFFGKYSYAMYLFHMSIAIIALDFFWYIGLRGWYMYFIYLGVVFGFTVLVSLLSWHLLEKHMLNLKKYFETR